MGFLKNLNLNQLVPATATIESRFLMYKAPTPSKDVNNIKKRNICILGQCIVLSDTIK